MKPELKVRYIETDDRLEVVTFDLCHGYTFCELSPFLTVAINTKTSEVAGYFISEYSNNLHLNKIWSNIIGTIRHDLLGPTVVEVEKNLHLFTRDFSCGMRGCAYSRRRRMLFHDLWAEHNHRTITDAVIAGAHYPTFNEEGRW